MAGRWIVRRADRCAVGLVTLVVASAGFFGAATESSLADQAGGQDAYWWVSQVDASQRTLTLVYDRGCSSAPVRPVVSEASDTIRIQVVEGSTTAAPCSGRPALGQLRVQLSQEIAGRPVLGERPDPAFPGGTPTYDVAGQSRRLPDVPRVIGLSVLDAKLALRMAGLVPHALTHSLTAEVTAARRADARSTRVLLSARTAPRHPRVPPPSAPAASSSSPGASANEASVPMSACRNANLVPTQSNLAQVGLATICLVNQQREQAGLAPLVGEVHLQTAAEQKATDMAQNQYFDHTSPSGVTFAQRLLSCGYVPADTGYSVGENLAWGTNSDATPANIVTAWMNSPEHRANILDASFQDTGLAVYPAPAPASAQGQPGATYVQEFGVLYN